MIKFDVERLEEVIKKVYLLCHVKISIFDDNLNEILYYPKKYSDFCALVRSKQQGDKACERSDMAAIEIVKQTKQLYKFVCPHGLTEVFYPIIVDDIFVGLMTMGQILPSDEQAEELLEKTSYLKINENDLRKSIDTLERVSDEHLDASALLVNLCAQYLYQNRLINIVNDETADKIKKYIDEHISEKITADTLCKEFYLSKVTLYRIFSEYFNTSVAEYVRNKKLELAKKLIEKSPSMQIAEIGEAVGIDANYFPKVFRKKYGYCPKKYQKKGLKK